MRVVGWLKFIDIRRRCCWRNGVAGIKQGRAYRHHKIELLPSTVTHVVVRDYQPEDRDALLELASRLTTGVAPWRDAVAVASAVHDWVAGSIDRAAQGHGGVFVAVVDDQLAGFVSVAERPHFTGTVDAYVGELVAASGAEGRGIGRELLTRAEQWARDRGYQRMTLETGARNARALRLYDHLGWDLEDVRLSKPLTPPPGPSHSGGT
jgi:GNAT superfamily N-acetyltransferase